MNTPSSLLLLGLILAISPSCKTNEQGDTAPTTGSAQESSNTTNTDQNQSADANTPQPLPPEEYKSEEFDKIGWELMERESFGGIQLNMDSMEVINVLGNPDSITPTTLWGADEGMHNEWIYPDKGITLGMNRVPTHPDPFYHKTRIDRMNLYPPTSFSTKRKISIGSPVHDVLINYRKAIADTTGYNDHLVAGTIYGGLVFTIHDDTVSKIFLGAAAE